jgi:ABC-type transport system involved in cytochrome c biogenesis permease subunit
MKKIKNLKYQSFGVLIIILIALVAATFIEKQYGSDFVAENVYGAWWFVALWAVLGITAFVYIIRSRLYRRKAVFLLHCAFVLILMGAGITFFTANRGYIHIRQGESNNIYISDNDNATHELPFDVKLILFDIEYHTGTDAPADFISFLKINNQICQVSMNKIYSYKGYRFYQIDYDADEMGSTLLINHDPLGICVTYAGYLLLLLSMLWILLIKTGILKILYFALPVAGLWFYISQLNPMTPVLRSPMLAAHVSIIMASYSLLLFITVTSIIALFMKSKREKFYRINEMLIYPAVFMLAAGIFLGAVWANISWGRYWGWDAKETWALITLLIYAIPMHKNSFQTFRKPVKFHTYCACAFLAVAITFFGVSYFFGGIHSYV